ncbi:hypothetical protein [Ruegeria aquimaris]|uniref:Uncharacterized protein n=1 Tax=Ruegeria aquimaris TaxID=2984333 RepID=A0ABT3ARW2_9RHOB|nr:hypothetical protein [Ruegeria sp. XHP0148]MCV2891425.1 hypothetical protein [Ruegeria sp. XHP0148]
MLATKQKNEWEEGAAARLGSQIRESMARLASEQPSQNDVVTIGRLIDQRIEESFNRGLRAALSSAVRQAKSSDR